MSTFQSPRIDEGAHQWQDCWRLRNAVSLWKIELFSLSYVLNKVLLLTISIFEAWILVAFQNPHSLDESKLSGLSHFMVVSLLEPMTIKAVIQSEFHFSVEIDHRSFLKSKFDVVEIVFTDWMKSHHLWTILTAW